MFDTAGSAPRRLRIGARAIVAVPWHNGSVSGGTSSIYPTGAQAAARWSGLEAAVQAPFPAPPHRRASHRVGH
jgi:hypothetical protein